MTELLILPRLEVLKANAFSSAYSVGFPALTAWYGFTHALERQLIGRGHNIKLSSFGVVAYRVEVDRHKTTGDRVFSLKDVGKPLKPNGGRPSSIESATCSLNASVVIEINGEFDKEQLIQDVSLILLSRLRCCSGTILTFHKPWITKVQSESDFKWLKRTLMPGFALISKRDEMLQSMSVTNNAIESLIDKLGIHFNCVEDKQSGEITWEINKTAGWLVPMGVGFKGISELKNPSNILHARDKVTPHRFVESLVTLGEFVMSYRLKNLDNLLWKPKYEAENQMYVLEQLRD